MRPLTEEQRTDGRIIQSERNPDDSCQTVRGRRTQDAGRHTCLFYISDTFFRCVTPLNSCCSLETVKQLTLIFPLQVIQCRWLLKRNQAQKHETLWIFSLLLCRCINTTPPRSETGFSCRMLTYIWMWSPQTRLEKTPDTVVTDTTGDVRVLTKNSWFKLPKTQL